MHVDEFWFKPQKIIIKLKFGLKNYIVGQFDGLFFVNFSGQGLLGLKLKQQFWNVYKFKMITFETKPNAKH